MDYIIELSLSDGFDAILVCVDRLTKMAHFCSTITKVTAEDITQLYLQYVFKHHGLPMILSQIMEFNSFPALQLDCYIFARYRVINLQSFTHNLMVKWNE